MTETDEFRVFDVKDLMTLHYEDIQVLAQNQIESDPDYEVCAKAFTGAVASIINMQIEADRRGRVETRLFAPYVGKSPAELKKAMKSKKKPSRGRGRK